MVTFEAEDDTMFSDSMSVESFNLDEIYFSISFEEGVIESYLTVLVFVNDQKGDFPINDQSNTQIVPVDHFGPISEQYPDTSHLYRANMVFEKSIGKKRKKDTGTKKINCLFKLSVLCWDDSKWRVTVRNGRHSHDPPESLVGHVTSSLSEEEYHRVVQLYDDDLFFAHPKLEILANTFHNFVILDNTYKTNLYDMPLLTVVSHTSTKAPFTVALCFMQFERENNFLWALERLKEIYLYDNVPTLFLIDFSQAMIKAVKRVFPFSTHLLCTWHINKDMMAYCKPIIKPPKKKKKKKTRVMSKMR
ncbi:hypothetical protein MKX03_032387 [Papaver bracteatum]|nr:hypothetical protein MKX03_032387 [Papaver bracteatum]